MLPGGSQRRLAQLALALLCLGPLTCSPGALELVLQTPGGRALPPEVVKLHVSVEGQGMSRVDLSTDPATGLLDLGAVPFGPARVVDVQGIDREKVAIWQGHRQFDLAADTGPLTIDFAPCTGMVYPDADGDGYGVTERGRKACPGTTGYAEKGGDCNDAAKDVHPNQTAFFAQAIGGSFDYDCNNVEEREYTLTSFSCSNDCKAVGWPNATLPDCGTTATLMRCKQQGNCKAQPEQTQVRCR